MIPNTFCISYSSRSKSIGIIKYIENEDNSSVLFVTGNTPLHLAVMLGRKGMDIFRVFKEYFIPFVEDVKDI